MSRWPFLKGVVAGAGVMFVTTFLLLWATFFLSGASLLPGSPAPWILDKKLVIFSFLTIELLVPIFLLRSFWSRRGEDSFARGIIWGIVLFVLIVVANLLIGASSFYLDYREMKDFTPTFERRQ